MPKCIKEFKLKLVTEYLSGKSGEHKAITKKYNLSNGAL